VGGNPGRLIDPAAVDTSFRRTGLARFLHRGRGRKSAPAAVAIALILAVIFPFVLSNFSLNLFALFFPFAILAYSLDLLWGENRIVSFGHGAFFVGGAYVGGLILLGRPYDIVGGHTKFLEEDTATPVFNRVLDGLHGPSIAGVPILALILPPLITGLVGLVIGAIVFRVGSPEVYIPLVTLGIGVIAALEFNDIEAIGASNGLGSVPSFTAGLDDDANPTPALYGFNAGFLVLVILGYYLFRRSRRGLVYQSSGDDPIRLEALGYRIHLVRTLGFGASTALAGLAGALYVSASHYIGPQTAGVLFSAQALIWVAVGGVGMLFGPLIGVLAVKWGEHYLSSNLGLEESWPLLLGLILILVVLVAPTGLAGLPKQLRATSPRLARRRSMGAAREERASKVDATSELERGP
jgi:ABC-type branched-subunit amino acid transport system permease subunit